MNLLNDLGIKVPNGKVARTPEEAFDVATELGKNTHTFLSNLKLLRNFASHFSG